MRLAEDVMENKATMIMLEDNLLQKLSSVKGSIVDDDELIKVLHTTKTTALEVGQKLAVSAETEVQINASREEYRYVQCVQCNVYNVYSVMFKKIFH